MAELSQADVHRLHLADVTLPEGSPLAAQVCPVYGFVITHPEGVIVFDTGVGERHSAIEALYRPVRMPLARHLNEMGIPAANVAFVVNSHLHFDHCGGNRLFPGTPILVQRAEREAASEAAYTVPEWVEFTGASFEILDGEREVLPGAQIIPTPGHTPGHQSLLLETREGAVIIAGQAAYTAEEYANPEQGHPNGLDGAWDREKYVESLYRLHDFEPRRVYFSHDLAVWDARDLEELTR